MEVEPAPQTDQSTTAFLPSVFVRYLLVRLIFAGESIDLIPLLLRNLITCYVTEWLGFLLAQGFYRKDRIDFIYDTPYHRICKREMQEMINIQNYVDKFALRVLHISERHVFLAPYYAYFASTDRITYCDYMWRRQVGLSSPVRSELIDYTPVQEYWPMLSRIEASADSEHIRLYRLCLRIEIILKIDRNKKTRESEQRASLLIDRVTDDS